MEIVVLGVTFGKTSTSTSSPIRTTHGADKFDEMQLLNKPIFHLDAENVAINVVESTDDGRIFLGGRDGYLYELTYQAESNWFGKRCKKVNISQSVMSYIVPNFLKVFTPNDSIVQIVIDESRNLLFLLTVKGSIEAYDLGTDTNSIKRFAKLSQHELATLAGNIARTVEVSIFKQITKICVLTYSDCPALNLIAVTETGARLFFSIVQQCVQKITPNPLQTQHSPLKANITQQTMMQTSRMSSPSPPKRSASPRKSPTTHAAVNNKQGNGLYLIHVRLPPGYTPNTTIIKPKLVHAAHYHDGNLLLVSTTQQSQDLLWAISSAPFVNRPYFGEAIEVVAMDGIVWKIANVPVRENCNSVLRKSQKPNKIVLLTNHGAHIIALLKAVDILSQLLMAYHGPHHTSIKSFFQTQSEVEACITCLILTCSEQYRGTEVGMWAAQAFLLYGGEPTYQKRQQINTQMQLISNTESSQPQMLMSTPMPNIPCSAFARTMQSPIPNAMQQTSFPLSPIANLSSLNSSLNTSNEASNMVFSAKHDSLYTYVARSLRPIWKKRCIDSKLNTTISFDECAMVLDDLNSIKSFLENNTINDLYCNSSYTFGSQGIVNQNGFNQMLHSNNLQMQNEQRSLAEHAQSEEKRSISALAYFLRHACEVIGLWKILCERPFTQLTAQLSKEQNTVLTSSTFYELILSRGETCAQLIVALVNSYIKDNASVSGISTKLREICPNLYRHEDAVAFKATEMMVEAKNCANALQRQEKLLNALHLCKEAAPNLPLHNICQQFILANFYEGVIELTVTCASKSDPEQYGVHYYNNDEPVEDREGYSYFATRINFYKEVRLMLDKLFETQTKSCDETDRMHKDISPSAELTKIVHHSMQAKDPLLHITIYEWLMSHDMISMLLSLVEPSLGDYLRRNVLRYPENFNLIDLLWKYYEKNGHHSQAANILDNLSSMQSDGIPLGKRVEYLARAVMCMRNDSVGYSMQNGVLLKDVEDKLEIARVQKTVLDAISDIRPQTADTEKAIIELNSQLYDITQLYQNYANVFALWECKLAILNCSHHNDALLIESVWDNIIKDAMKGCSTTTERCSRLFTKIESLVKEFSQSGNCFPLAFIIHELEKNACKYSMPEAIVPQKLLAMNIDIEMMLEYYARMIVMNERIWAQEGNEWQLVQSAISIVRTVADSIPTLWYRSKRRVIGKAQDIIAACLNLCYQKPNTDNMQHVLKEIQCRLQRSA